MPSDILDFENSDDEDDNLYNMNEDLLKAEITISMVSPSSVYPKSRAQANMELEQWRPIQTYNLGPGYIQEAEATSRTRALIVIPYLLPSTLHLQPTRIIAHDLASKMEI